jgi:hypothetical protein
MTETVQRLHIVCEFERIPSVAYLGFVKGGRTYACH